MLELTSPEDRFARIYSTNHWNNPESSSGEGSTLENTHSLRQALPDIFLKHSVHRCLDAPCGDFNWMKSVLEETEIEYVGGDIVRPLIEQNNERYGADSIRFVHLDITTDQLPGADLMICRDCLFHLSFEDIRLFFGQFLKSGIPLLLTSSHSNVGAAFQNADIRTGDFRAIDLFSKPFGFSRDILEQIDDTQVSTGTKRFMILVERVEIERVFKAMTAELAGRPQVADGLTE